MVAMFSSNKSPNLIFASFSLLLIKVIKDFKERYPHLEVYMEPGEANVLNAGVVVSSISLHNEEFIQSKDIRIGDQVLVERAGDVIPYVIGPVESARIGSERIFIPPEICPACDQHTAFPEVFHEFSRGIP